MKISPIAAAACILLFVSIPVEFLVIAAGMISNGKGVLAWIYLMLGASYLAVAAGAWNMKKWTLPAAGLMAAHWAVFLRDNIYANIFFFFAAALLALGVSQYGRAPKTGGDEDAPAAAPANGMAPAPAGIWLRSGAAAIDIAIYISAAVLIMAPWGSPLRYPMLVLPASILVAAAMTIVLTGVYGQTLGKMAAGISVTAEGGARAGYGRSAARYFSGWLTFATAGAGMLPALFSERKRALHDRLSGTEAIALPGAGRARKVLVAAMSSLWLALPASLLALYGGGPGPGYSSVMRSTFARGPHHPETIAAKEALGDRFYSTKGNCRAALPWYESALGSMKRGAVPDRAGFRRVLVKYSMALRDCGKTERADDIDAALAGKASGGNQ